MFKLIKEGSFSCDTSILGFKPFYRRILATSCNRFLSIVIVSVVLVIIMPNQRAEFVACTDRSCFPAHNSEVSRLSRRNELE